MNYYDNNAEEYSKKTDLIDMSVEYDNFKFCKGMRVLDAGCGSGRDLFFFKSKGCIVEGFDASIELCEIARKKGLDVKNETFQTFKTNQKFDLIWASASLLHLNEVDLRTTLLKFSKMMKKDAKMYISLKEGEGSEESEGREFFYYTIEKIKDIIDGVDVSISNSYESSRIAKEGFDDVVWLTIILSKEA